MVSFLSLPMVVSLSTYTDNIYRGKMLLDIEGGRDHAEQLKSSGEAIGGRVEAYLLYVKPPDMQCGAME